MTQRLSLSELGAIVAEPTRLRILHELLEGVPLPAGAIAARLGVAPSTVSSHLARLQQAELIELAVQGRMRLATIASPEVAEAVEALLRLTAEPAVSSLTEHSRRATLREARSCYDHLAGGLGVALAKWTLERGWVVPEAGSWRLTNLSGLEAGLGLSVVLPDTRRPEVRPCMDWTERQPHLAGKLGAALLSAMLEATWLQRRSGTRGLEITELGRENVAAYWAGPVGATS